jgi:hypothetical protein
MMKLNRKKFYTLVKKDLFKDKFIGPKGEKQIQGMDLLIDEFEKRKLTSAEFAYVLATVYHETAYTMQPIAEYGGTDYLKSKKYWPYYGRGFVQLTWKENYKKASDKFGVDFVSHPEKVMDIKYAVPILFDGMIEGWFTGKSLSDYIDGIDESEQEDFKEYEQARRIINGVDKKSQIARHAVSFWMALEASAEPLQAPLPVPAPLPLPQPPTSPVEPPKSMWSFVFDLIFTVIKAIFGRK